MSLDIAFTKRFADFKLDVRLNADDGIVALFGASGSGKSLTLKCIAGILQPDEGHIIVNGRTLFDSAKKINRTPQERQVGLLFQNYSLFPNMTVAQNIACGLRSHRNNTDRQARVSQLINTFYLTGLEHHHPDQLSGGQQQRTALARILASEPQILMLDEPLSALDSSLRWQLEQEMTMTLRGFPWTTLFVSHNRGEVYRVSDTVIAIHQGQTEAGVPVDAFFRSPVTRSAAILSGVKNISRIMRHEQDGQLWAEDWQVMLPVNKTFTAESRFVGIQTASIELNAAENAFDCKVNRITEDLSCTVLQLTPIRVKIPNERSTLWMELSKSEARDIHEGAVLSVGFAAENILFLK